MKIIPNNTKVFPRRHARWGQWWSILPHLLPGLQIVSWLVFFAPSCALWFNYCQADGVLFLKHKGCGPPPGASHYIKERAHLSVFSWYPAHTLASFRSWTFLFSFKHAKLIPAMSRGLSTCCSFPLGCFSFASTHNHLSHYSCLISDATILARLSLVTVNKDLLSALGDIAFIFSIVLIHTWNCPVHLFKYLLDVFTR